MKYFQKISDGFEVAPVVHEVALSGLGERHPGNFRSLSGKPNPNPFNLRFIDQAAFWQLPLLNSLFAQACDVLRSIGGYGHFAASVRIMPPRSTIKPHRDDIGDWHRYQLALQCDDQAVFTIKNERCTFKPGELWRVDIRDLRHGVVNRSEDARGVVVINAWS